MMALVVGAAVGSNPSFNLIRIQPLRQNRIRIPNFFLDRIRIWDPDPSFIKKNPDPEPCFFTNTGMVYDGR